MIDYIIVGWLSFSLGLAFSQTRTGKDILQKINMTIDLFGIKKNE